MEVHSQACQLRHTENNPGENGGKKEEGEHAGPNCGCPVKHAQRRVGIAICEQRSGDKAHRQKAEHKFGPERSGRVASWSCKCPRFIEEQVDQTKKGLDHCNETDQTLSSHFAPKYSMRIVDVMSQELRLRERRIPPNRSLIRVLGREQYAFLE